MKKELRLLLIEDVGLDAELIQHELRRSGLHFQAKRVETADQFLHEIEHHAPDLILSDHGVPTFDGFTALATARERCPEVPFIFVTGAHGDEVAVETLKRGADDYVLKSRLHLLAPAIQRALRQADERAKHRQMERALRQLKDRFGLLAEAAQDFSLFALDPTGRVADWPSGAERLTGHAAADVLGRPLTTLFPEEEQERVRRALKQALAEQRSAERGWRVLRKSGGEITAAALLSPTRDASGRLEGFVCVLQDLTREEQLAEKAQRKAEHAAHQRAVQGEANYRELQEFTCTLALELRTPLRHIDSFVDLLQKTASDRLDPKSQGNLKTIATAARDMGHLLDELLAFARVGQTQMLRLQFNLAEVVQEVLQELRCDTEAREIEWVIGEMPTVTGDPAMLGQVLTTLISNALKFTRPRKHARIELGSAGTEREIIVFVADNGVGFDPRYQEKLFGVFQRLHPASEFEGLGVGLANVRRIVQRHGGRAWAEGAPGRGATFYFSLPRTRPPPEEALGES